MENPSPATAEEIARAHPETGAEVSAPASPATPAPPVETSPRVSLTDFCVRLSGQRGASVELIAVFAHMERAAGRNFDTEGAYAQRYAAAGSHPTA